MTRGCVGVAPAETDRRPRRARHVIGAALIAAVLMAAPASALDRGGARGPTSPSLGPAPAIPAGRPSTARAALAPLTASAGSAWIDTTDRAAVVASYIDEFWSVDPDPGFTGSVATCVPGTTSAAHRAAVLDRVNWYRSMAGAGGPVVDDPALVPSTQAAALIMAAAGDLSHDPPEAWPCWTAAGAEGAGESNLALGATGTEAIDLYIQDPGDHNTSVGHRWWILLPTQTRMGVGDVPGADGRWGANALNVVSGYGSGEWATRDPGGYVAWPPPGYVPRPVVAARWSLFAGGVWGPPGPDLSGSSVSVTVGGTPVPVTVESRQSGRVVFVPTLPSTLDDLTVSVEVTGIRNVAAPASYTWTTTVVPVLRPDENFVVAAFRDFLGRSPTEEDLRYHVALLRFSSRRDVVMSLAESPEWVGALVDRYYQDTLGRAGDPGGRSFWIDRIIDGRMTPSQVAASFYSSDEYFRTFGQGSTGVWVADLYAKLLGRTPDAGGSAYWQAQTAARGRGWVARQFYDSAESRRVRVRRLYQDLLGRDPDPGGLAYWAGVILRTGDDVTLAVDLASSEEYYRRAQP